MVSFNQTSWFEIEESEASSLLRYAPARAEYNGTPTLSFRIENELVCGAQVFYRLISGFRFVDWKGTISSVSGNSFTADLRQGPFSIFHAEHLSSQEGNLVQCEDILSFNGETESFAQAMDKAHLKYEFSARKETRAIIASFESERKTESFEALDMGNASAG